MLLIYKKLEEFVHQHFSKRRNETYENASFQISKCYSKRSFYHGTNEFSIKQCSHELLIGFFFFLILGIVIGTNLGYILANIYMVLLEEELQIIYKNNDINSLKYTKDF